VEVDERVPLAVLGVRGVLLQMRAVDAHALGAVAARDLEPAVHVEREVVLRDLVALRQVGVHVILAVELRVLGHLAVEREARGDRELDRAPVRDRERARQTQADRAHERVRRRPEPLRAAGAEHLRRGPELDVRLDADDELVRCRHGVCRGRGMPVGTGPSVLSWAGMTRLRLTMTRSPLTETRYWSRSRAPESIARPRPLKVGAAPPPHSAMKVRSSSDDPLMASRVQAGELGGRGAWVVRTATYRPFAGCAMRNSSSDRTMGMPMRFAGAPTAGRSETASTRRSPGTRAGGVASCGASAAIATTTTTTSPANSRSATSRYCFQTGVGSSDSGPAQCSAG